jgi:ADP-ribosyl-[dinitrogen reductase] hydrolase
MNRINICLGSYYGSIVGDALGGPYEFRNRRSAKTTFVENYVHNNNFDLPPGSWTDDTSMMLCISQSLQENGCFDPKDQLDKFLNWSENGYMSSNDTCFDIGNTTRLSLYNYKRFGYLISIFDNNKNSGNGSLMRLTCIPIFFRNKSYDECIKYCKLSSQTTHSSKLCIEGCEILGGLIHIIINNSSEGVSPYPLKGVVSKKRLISFFISKLKPKDEMSEEYHFIYDVEYMFNEFINSEPMSSGYIVHSIQCCLYSFIKYDNFKDSIINIVKLGDDADTNACITGMLCGAYYGIDEIPQPWITGLVKPELLLDNFKKLIFL